jgi:hypothetical protein
MAITPRSDRATESETRTVRRFGFAEDPASTQIRRERLPADQPNDGGPELAYRAQRLTDDEARRYATRYAMRGVFLLPPLLFAIVTLPLFVPQAELIALVLGLVAAVMRALLFGDRNPKTFLQIAFLPALALLAGDLLRYMLDAKIPIAFFYFWLGSVAFFVCAFLNEGLIGFGWVWLTSDPSFSSKESKQSREYGHALGYAAKRHGGTSGPKSPRVWIAAVINFGVLLLIGWLILQIVESGFAEQSYNIWLSKEEARHQTFGPGSTVVLSKLIPPLILLVISVAALRFALRRAGTYLGHLQRGT